MTGVEVERLGRTNVNSVEQKRDIENVVKNRNVL